MAYFLGRDVDVFLTTESKNNHSGSTVQFLVESGGEIELSTAAGTGQIVPPMANDAAVVSGSISDVTGVDLSISVSDEDVGPFLGKPQIMQKVELRKETVVTLTLKKKNNFFDVMFNGPAASTKFDGGAIKASRIFNHNEYYIILEFWYNDLSLCSIMSCYGEISWIRSRNLKLICGTSK